MTEILKKKSTTKLLAIALAVTVLFVVFWRVQIPSVPLPEEYPQLPETPSQIPDSSWWIVSSIADPFHNYAIDTLTDYYGGEKVDWTEGRNWNTDGQNLILVGGGDDLSVEAEWIRTPALSLVKPTAQPNVYFSWDAVASVWTIYTPQSSYVCTVDDDYGFVTYAFDETLNRWIYVAIGWSGHCTIAGALILRQLSGSGSYMVYELAAFPSEEPWQSSQYAWTVVESDITG